MMFTKHPETALIPYARGELSAEERARVEQHLAECAECRAFAESSLGVLRKVGQFVDETPEPDWTVYRCELRRKLAARQETRVPWWRSGFALTALAGAGAAFAALLIVISLHRPPQLSTPPLDQMAMATEMKDADLGLLKNYNVVEHLDLLENYDVIERLDQMPPASQQGNEKSS
jgi:anti-sigma-K factor RskA